MDERGFHGVLLAVVIGVAAVTFIASFFVLAPYGRHQKGRWGGPSLPSWLGWMLMEAPQPVGFLLWYFLSERRTSAGGLALLGIWMFHYAYRTLVYPFIPRSSAMSLSVVLIGFVLNGCFSYLNSRWIFALGPERTAAWLTDPRFVAGVAIYLCGFVLHASSDLILRNLRKPGSERYVVPRGGAFRLVTSPNYLGEIVGWVGWAIASWSLAGLSIALVTAANLVPRARANHRWYRARFSDYPAERRALIPFVY